MSNQNAGRLLANGRRRMRRSSADDFRSAAICKFIDLVPLCSNLGFSGNIYLRLLREGGKRMTNE